MFNHLSQKNHITNIIQITKESGNINQCLYSSEDRLDDKHILRGTRNLSFVLRRSLLRTFETIWILVITLECSNITASKSIRRERKMRPMELSGVNFSTHGSESECSCFDQV